MAKAYHMALHLLGIANAYMLVRALAERHYWEIATSLLGLFCTAAWLSQREKRSKDE